MLNASSSVFFCVSSEALKSKIIPLHSIRSSMPSLVPILFKSSSNSSVHLPLVFLFSLFVPFWQSLFVLTFFRYSSFNNSCHLSVGDFIYFTVLFLVTYPLSPCLFCSPAFFFLCWAVNLSYYLPFEYSESIHIF